MLEEWDREMQEQQENRRRWIEARTAVAQELLRAHAGKPTPSLYHLRKSIHADDRLFEAAVNHRIDTGRLPRNFPRNIKESIGMNMSAGDMVLPKAPMHRRTNG